MIYHNGHMDYIVDGVLHFPHGDHCDHHGTIRVVEHNENEGDIEFD
jgi:hypothetical protein